MDFWITDQLHTVIHATPDCSRLVGVRHPVIRLDPDRFGSRELCKKCFPTRPRALAVLHTECPRCSPAKANPCAHNGGVLALIPHYQTVQDDVGGRLGKTERTFYYRRWVWPENAWRYTLVNPDGRE